MKKIIPVAIAVILIAVIATVLSKPKQQAGGAEPIRIGAIISQTGFAAQFGEMSQKGIDLAVKEINDAGGIEGRKVEIVYEDDRTDPKTAAGLYHKLQGVDNVDAIIGSNFDFVTQPIFALAATGDTVVISPSNPRIPGAFDTNKNSFLMMSDFDKIISAFKGYLTKETFSKIAIVRFDSGFSAEISRVLNDIVVGIGKPDIIEHTYKEIGNNDFRTAILKLKSAQVDLVFLDMIGADPMTFVTQARQLGFNPKYISHDGLRDSMGTKGVDPKLFDGFIAVDWNVSPDSFAQKFKAEYGVEQTNSANRAYDAVYILAEAIVNSETKADVGKYLTDTAFTTPNGKFDFSPEHSAQNTDVKLVIVKEGKYTDYK